MENKPFIQTIQHNIWKSTKYLANDKTYSHLWRTLTHLSGNQYLEWPLIQLEIPEYKHSNFA